MNEEELGQILKKMYNHAPKGDQVASIHLFGVKYAQTIKQNHLNVKDIVLASGLSSSYGTEVSKGIKLSRYVVPK